MTSPRRRKDLGRRGWTLLVALGIGLVLVAELRAEEALEADGPSAGGSQDRVEELMHRVQVMEGKLRDSAAARKTADQARMEAERRLAEGNQEAARQRAEMALLRDAKQALELRLKNAEDQADRSAEDLTAAQETVRRLTAERDRETRRAANLERQVDQLQAKLQGAEAEREERPRTLSGEQPEPSQSPSGRDVGRETGQVPEDGGLTLEEAEAKAAAAAVALREAIARAEGVDDAQCRRAVREAEQVLYRRQLAVARVTGARSLYRVRTSDSLDLIASRFYGDSSRWKEVHEANRTVLADPDHLTPGITLVIP